MKTLIITGSKLGKNERVNPCYEVSRLQQVASNFYDRVILLNPNELKFIIQPSKKHLDVVFDNTSLGESTSLIVRTTNGCEESTRLMALSLYSRGCELLDPVERFNGTPAGKSSMTLKGMKNKSLPDTFISFSEESALHLLQNQIDSSEYPLVGKPTIGSQGQDVSYLPDYAAAEAYIHQFFSRYTNPYVGLLFQHYIAIKQEFRVILLDGEILGIVEKHESKSGFARNAALGSEFVAVDNEEIGDFAKALSNSKGLLGVDVALNVEGQLYIIEANRSPQWQSFEKATGINVAEQIFQTLEKRLTVTSELF